jgi:hypothetical protein
MQAPRQGMFILLVLEAPTRQSIPAPRQGMFILLVLEAPTRQSGQVIAYKVIVL